MEILCILMYKHGICTVVLIVISEVEPENSVLMAIPLMIFMTTHNWRSKVDVSQIFAQNLNS